MMKRGHIGAIEGGGTKFVCAVSSTENPIKIIDRMEFPTTSPQETLPKAASFFEGRPINALGIGSFGPVCVDPEDPRHGHILNTPKPGWQNTDVSGFFSSQLHVPVAIDTDVNCAAIGEQSDGDDSDGRLVYMTVGTGIGVGIAEGGRSHHGASHAELGHMLFPKLGGNVRGACPYHECCLEGLASGTALAQRWGVRAAQITNKSAWSQEAEYLAFAVANIVLAYMPAEIVLGGGVMKHVGLVEDVRHRLPALINGYVELPTDHLETYIHLPRLGNDSGVTGALALAHRLTIRA